MNAIKKLKYISYRIILLWCGLMCILISCVVYCIILFSQKEIPGLLLGIVLFIVFSYAFTSIYFVYKPYKDSEKIIQRFLDGYELSIDSVYMTPSTEKQIQKIAAILHSPDVFELNKRQAQYLALQNQINPHFLYNTLESIRSEALIAGLDTVADMTEALAVFFRYTISRVENLVSVEEELENCKTYFRIQKYRFNNRIQLQIEYDEEEWQDISAYRIPKLTLQPILENSIIHGTELKLGTSILKIHFQRTEKRLLIRISDDGVGMDEQTLWKLNKKLRNNNDKELYNNKEEKGGIALVNVNNRIHLLFGEEYGIHVYSIPNVGTDVEISIPAIVSDREVKNRGVL